MVRAVKKTEKNKSPEKSVGANPPTLLVGERRSAPLQSYMSDSLAPYDPLKHYLMEIKRYPLLSREEEQRLAIR